jgi:hypothetical protein
MIERCWCEAARDRWKFTELEAKIRELISTFPQQQQRDIGSVVCCMDVL